MQNEILDASRREFLKTATAGALALIGGASAIATLSSCGKNDPVSARTGEKVSFSLNDEGFASLRTIGGVARRNFGSARNGGRDVIIRRIGETEFRTVSVVCPHAGCDVGTPTPTQVECPCHNSVFSLQASNFGARVSGPAARGLASFETTFNAETQTVTITF